MSQMSLCQKVTEHTCVYGPCSDTEKKKPVSGLTPEFIVVGTAARLSAAVSCLTEVTWIVVYPRTVLGTDDRLVTRTPMELHHLMVKTRHTCCNSIGGNCSMFALTTSLTIILDYLNTEHEISLLHSLFT